MVENSEFGPDDFAIYYSTGEEDIAYDAVVSMKEGLQDYPETFRFTDNFAEGNIHVDLVEDFWHDYPYGNHYIYNSLRTFFVQK